MRLSFRGRLGPHVVAAVVAAVLTALGGLGARVALRPLGLRVPWLTVALAAGAAVFLWRYLAVYRRRGVAVDDDGIGALDGTVAIRWDDIATLRFCACPHETGGGVALVRYAALERDGGGALAFCDHGPLGRDRIVTPHGRLADVAESGLLVALVAERLGLAELLPAASPGPADAASPAAAAPGVTAAAAPTPTGLATVRTAYGLLPLVAKLGPKLAGGAAKLGQALLTGAKTFKLGTAAVSLGAYSLLLSWQSAVALMIMIAWHEYGHVHAMRRCGVKVRGIYFIPFVGGAAVHEAPIGDRASQAYVALNGPLWGFYLTLVPLVGFFATGERHPFLAVTAAIWAALNLFNLLPILPLDGGRALSAIAFSIHSAAGVGLAAVTLVLGLVLAVLSDFGLLALVLGVGVLEFAGDLGHAQRRRCFAALECAPALDFPAWHRLQALARTVTQGQDGPRALAGERATFERSRAVLQGRPMGGWQLALCAAGYAGLAVALVAIIVVMRHVPGADLVHGLLR